MIKTFKDYSKYLLTEAIWDKTGILKGKNLLYHWVRNTNDLFKILETNYLKSSASHWGASVNYIKDDDARLKKDSKISSRKIVCFTRNPIYNIHLNKWCLIIDKDLLKKDGEKTYPFSYHGVSNHNQFEEFYLGDFKNVSDYLIGIGVSKGLGLSETVYKEFNKNIITDTLYNMGSNPYTVSLNSYIDTNFDEIKEDLYKITELNYPLINFYNGKTIEKDSIDLLIDKTKTSQDQIKSTNPNINISKEKIDLSEKTDKEILKFLETFGFYYNGMLNIPRNLIIKNLNIMSYMKTVSINNPYIENITFQTGEYDKILILNTSVLNLNLPKAFIYKIQNNSKLTNIDFTEAVNSGSIDISNNIALTNINLDKINKVDYLTLPGNALQKLEIPKSVKNCTVTGNPLSDLKYWNTTFVKGSNPSNTTIEVLE